LGRERRNNKQRPHHSYEISSKVEWRKEEVDVNGYSKRDHPWKVKLRREEERGGPEKKGKRTGTLIPKREKKNGAVVQETGQKWPKPRGSSIDTMPLK